MKKSRAKQLGIKVINEEQLRIAAGKRDPIEDCYNLANDRARLEHALRQVFTSLGVGEKQQDKVIIDIKLCDWSSLDKLIKRG